ncbi:hypothetical protein ABPG72_017120 [Tetrahymena utriculariae]
MDKILKNISTLLLEVQETLLNIKAYKDVNKVYLAFLEKVEKILLKETKNDLIAAFETMHDTIEAQELSHQKKHVHHLTAIITIQTIIKLGDGLDILSKKNALGQIIKTYIAEKIQSLCMSESEQFKNCLLILSYFTVGFNCWRKCRDHVPELYSGMRYLFIFLQKQLVGNNFDGKNTSVTLQQNSDKDDDKQRLITFDNLFESVIINNEKSLSHNSLLAFLRICIAFLNNTFKITNMESNFDFLYQPIFYQLQDIYENGKQIGNNLKEYLKGCQDKIAEWTNDFSYKSSLDILIEKPIIKIKQLDPRIIEKGKALNSHLEKSKVKKKLKNHTKKVIKEIKSDQAILDKKKYEDFVRDHAERDQARKKFVTIMDNQALEIKKIRTTQINFHRNKKKKTRLAGNATS